MGGAPEAAAALESASVALRSQCPWRGLSCAQAEGAAWLRTVLTPEAARGAAELEAAKKAKRQEEERARVEAEKAAVAALSEADLHAEIAKVEAELAEHKCWYARACCFSSARNAASRSSKIRVASSRQAATQ